MKIVIKKEKKDINEHAYNMIVETINSKPEVTIGLATGSSPEGIYALFRENNPDVSHVTTFNLDEYVGLGSTHDQSYRYYMDNLLFNHLNFKKTHVPIGDVEDLSAECLAYEKLIEQSPIDLQLLGVGSNGHIAFNEPGTSLDSITHVVDLAESTIEANSRFFDSIDDVPKRAVTMGLKTIMQAKKIVLIAMGESKIHAIKAMVDGPVSTDCPASILQNHPDVTIILDEEAAKLLNEKV